MAAHPAEVFHGNVTIITGASAGIGLEIARRLSLPGAAPVLAARYPELLDQAASMCRTHGAKVLAVPTDVSDMDQCRGLIEAAIGEFGRIDTLANNAGISMHARSDEITDIGIAERRAARLGTILRAVAPAMIDRLAARGIRRGR